MDPLRSAKRTVACFRSLSTALLDGRIRSARCFGVYASGEAKLDDGAVAAVGVGDGEAVEAGVARCGIASGWPHPPQNFSAASLANPHEGHAEGSGAPHSPQKRRPPRWSASAATPTT